MVLATAARCAENVESTKSAKEQEALTSDKKTEKRGLHESYGDFGGGGGYGGGGGGGYGGGFEGGDSGGAEDHHHEHVKTVTVVKKIPVPYEVHKKVPYLVCIFY